VSPNAGDTRTGHPPTAEIVQSFASEGLEPPKARILRNLRNLFFSDTRPITLLYFPRFDFIMEFVSPAEFAKDKVLAVQEYALLAARSLQNLFSRPRYIGDTLHQADLVGVGALPIVLLTSSLFGAVLALQSSNTLQRFGSLSLIGQLVSLSMVRELGPVLTGLMVAGRSASGMASELGSMKVTEQIDAMRALGTDPTKKLVTPRVVSTTVMMFFLTIISDLVGLAGGSAVATVLLGLDWHQYWSTSWQSLGFPDLVMGLVKPVFFGFIVSSIGCYFGLSTKGGTQGVGRSTTQAVVAASTLIVGTDLFITRFLMTWFPGTR
jgi:phospholipid/cholesterol/gamma-HCH transport system permease protein